MEDCLCIQTIAKSVILPCDVYADGEYAALHRRSGMLLLCYFEQDSIQVEHFLQQHRNESSLCIPIVTLIILMCQFPEYLTAVCMESDIISP